MVRVYTDHPELLNDLGEVIRLYLPMEEVVPAENGETAPFISAVMEESGDTWRAVCTADMDGARAEYVYLHPNVGGGELNRKRYRKRCMKIAVFRALGKVYKDARLPWGSLTGIRPTRLLRELIAEKGEKEALRFMAEEFDVTPEKLALAKEIVDIQRPFMDVADRDVDVYIGIPFCRTRGL